MRYSKLIGKTVKETPKDATAASHQFLVRGGFVHQTAAGIYSLLPLGFKVLQNVDRIIREEFERADIQQLLMPIVHPASLWEESGRYEAYTPPLAKFSNEKGQNFVVAPTHEEAATDIGRTYIKSYQDLPVIINQNQFKFRNEIRVQAGLLRTREFVMQDAYSFDADEAGLHASFEKMRDTYHRVFKRLGLTVFNVKADPGAMGGSGSEEFIAQAEVGEDRILMCDHCDYKANREVAVSHVAAYPQDKAMKPREDIEGKGVIGVEELAKFLKVEPRHTTKTLLFETDKGVVAAIVRGDYDINEIKLKKALGLEHVALARPEVVKEVTGAEVGYAGPVNLPKNVTLIADLTCEGRMNFEAGMNKTHYHSINVNFERDFPTPPFADIRTVKEGDMCDACKKGTLQMINGIELGHIFKLGLRYSEPMQVLYTDKDGSRKPVLMGCYGIGMTRAIAAIVETHHDAKGILWPSEVAPFRVHLISIGKAQEAGEKLYKLLMDAGISVLYDDRDERPGSKFADADLIGIPLRLVLSDKTLAEDGVEYKERSQEKAELVPMKSLMKRLQS